MITSFLRNRKKQKSPMKSGVTCVLIFVENFRYINRCVVTLISEFFLTSQIVGRNSFNIGLGCVVNTLKPARGLRYSPFFIFQILKRC